MSSMVLIEICTDNWEDSVRAIELGADRIELCSALEQDGLTPDVALFKRVKTAYPDILLFVMIRCRSGNFVYSEAEKRDMIYTAEQFSQIGADGLVVGALTDNGQIDFDFLGKFASAARVVNPDVQITFHKAFDVVACGISCDSFTEIAISLNYFCNRILTSGGHRSALEGFTNIRNAVMKRKSPIIIAAGGIRAHNIREVLRLTGAQEVHSRCPNIIEEVRKVCSILT